MGFWDNKTVVVTGGAGFLGSFVVEKLKERGIGEVSIPFRGKDKAKYGGKRFWALQKWRSGSEGTISVLKRERGWRKIRERGEAGFRRGVGMGIVTQNWVRLARAMG